MAIYGARVRRHGRAPFNQFLELVFLLSLVSKSNLMVGVFISALSISAASLGQAQSAGTSDSDYLLALTTMATDMDLNGLAAETHAPTTVAAPQLPDVGAMADVVPCESLQAQAAKAGHPIEIFGVDVAHLSNELSTCRMSETGVLVSYLMTGSQ